MSKKENNEELESAIESPNDESQSIEETIRKIKPFLDKLLNKKKELLLFNGAVFVLAVVLILIFVKPFYKSKISILPEYGNQTSVLSSLSGLASMAGINVGDVTPNQIYEKILNSERVIHDIVYKKYNTLEFADSVNLIDYFKVESTNEKLPLEMQEREKFLKVYSTLVEDKISTDIDRITTVLTITVIMPEPELSSEIANALVTSLNNYVTTDRQSYAREQSQYIFNRIKEVKDSLTLYENQLKDFKEENRVITNSPQLALEQNRLVRKVEIAQSVFLELTKQYELIKLEEVKDTPVVNIMEKAEQPIDKSGPNRRMIVIVIMLFSIGLSFGYVLFYQNIKKYFFLLTKK